MALIQRHILQLLVFKKGIKQQDSVLCTKKLTTFSGKVLEPQEFSITLPLSQNHELYSALAAITAAMLNDIKIPDKNYS